MAALSPLSPLFFLVRSMWSFSWMRICLSLGRSLMNGCLSSCSVLGLWLWLFTRQLSMKAWNFLDLGREKKCRGVTGSCKSCSKGADGDGRSPLLGLEPWRGVAWDEEEGSHGVHVAQRWRGESGVAELEEIFPTVCVKNTNKI